jgi:hypothetical protein
MGPVNRKQPCAGKALYNYIHGTAFLMHGRGEHSTTIALGLALRKVSGAL